MRALVTGGAGFIGSHLAEDLLKRGHDVCVLDDLSTGRLLNLVRIEGHPGFRLIIGSVADDSIVGEAVEKADVIFHLAAAVGVRRVVEKPLDTIETNVMGTATVLRHAHRADRRVVVTSSSEVYGKNTTLPFREDMDLVLGPPDKSRWSYASSKLLDEFTALSYWKQFGLKVSVARLFNTVGPRQQSSYGMVLPTFVRQALDGSTITVHGDGTQSRCFTWVGDVVSALIGIADEPKAIGQVYNVGNDREVTIRDLAHAVRDRVGSDSPIVFEPYAQVFDEAFEDMQRRVPDTQKIRDAIGFEPRVHLDEIIERTIAYWQAETTQSGGQTQPTAVTAL